MNAEEEYNRYRRSGTKDAATVNRLKAFSGLVCRHPHILLMPIIVAGLVVGLGTYGVLQGIDSMVNQARDEAAFDAQSSVKTFELSVQKALLPTVQLAASITTVPDYNKQQKNWFINAPLLWQAASEGVIYMRMSPFGRTTAVYPASDKFLPMVGTDLLNSTLDRPSILSTLRRKSFTVSGPTLTPTGVMLAEFWFPVYTTNTTDNETWGIPFQPTNCPRDLCYAPETKTKWWGMLSMGIDTHKFNTVYQMIQSLLSKGYRVQLWRPALGTDTDSGDRVNLVLDEPSLVTPPDDAISVEIPLGAQPWELVIWRSRWYPVWIKWMIAVIVFGALIISSLLFVVLLSRAEHRALLLSLLPKSTIQRIRAEAEWATQKQDELFNNMSLDTPAQNMMAIIASNVEGKLPPLPVLLTVRDALQRSADLYRPTAEHLKDKIQESEFVDAEVRQALVAQLVGQSNDRRSDTQQSAACLEDETFEQDHDFDCENAESPTIPASVGAKSYSVKAHENSTSSAMNKQIAGLISRHGSASACFMVPTGLLAMSPQVKLGVDIQDAIMLIMQLPPRDGSDNGKTGGLSKKLTSEDLSGESAGSEQRKSGGGKTVQFLLPRNSDKALRGQLSVPTTLTTVVEQDPGKRPLLIRVNSPSPSAPLITQVERALTAANGWSFDAFAFDEACNGRPLSVLGYWLMHMTGLKSWARMDSFRLASFLQCVEDGYANNPYHNRIHAADVLQSIHVILHRGGLIPGYIDNMTLLACYLAAIIHDYEHRGRSNDYLVNAHDDLAVRYNDRSPMENHHLAAAFSLLKRAELNILAGLSKPTWLKVRKLVIDLVLATDMKQHFAIQSQFQNQVVAGWSGGNASHSITSSQYTDGEASVIDNSSLPVSENDKLLSLQMALKCADLGHLTAPQKVHLRWVRALEEEFFLQGDEERDAGLTISPLCDRTKEGIAKSQVGFLDFVCVPQFKSFCQRFSQARPLLDGLRENRTYWKSAARAGTEMYGEVASPTRTSRTTPASMHG